MPDQKTGTDGERQDARLTAGANSSLIVREVIPLSSSALETHVNRKSPDFQKNARQMVDLLTEIARQEEKIRQGGGTKAIEAQHKKGRQTARERIAKLTEIGRAHV